MVEVQEYSQQLGQLEKPPLGQPGAWDGLMPSGCSLTLSNGLGKKGRWVGGWGRCWGGGGGTEALAATSDVLWLWSSHLVLEAELAAGITAAAVSVHPFPAWGAAVAGVAVSKNHLG